MHAYNLEAETGGSHEFEASLGYTEFEASLTHTAKPGVENKNKNKTKQRDSSPAQENQQKIFCSK